MRAHGPEAKALGLGRCDGLLQGGSPFTSRLQPSKREKVGDLTGWRNLGSSRGATQPGCIHNKALGPSACPAQKDAKCVYQLSAQCWSGHTTDAK